MWTFQSITLANGPAGSVPVMTSASSSRRSQRPIE